MKTFIKSMVCAAVLFTSFTGFTQAAPELVFTNPVLKSGELNKEGAVYRFANITSGVDAEVKLKKFSRNDIVMATVDNNTLGWNKAFQPEFGLPGVVAPNQHWYVDFEITFFKAGTMDKQKMQKVDLTALDVDGDGWSISEYVTYQNPSSVAYSTVTYLMGNVNSLLGQSFTCSADNISSVLVGCSNCGGDGRTGLLNFFECQNCDATGLTYEQCDHAFDGVNGSTVTGPIQNFLNIDTLATQVMATYQFQQTDRIKLRYGARSAANSSNGSGIRLNSTWFRQFSMAPVGTLPVTFHKYTASLDKKAVTLEWTVDTDDDFSYYTVERSTDGKNFSEIGLVMTTGSVREISTYKFRDANISAQSNVLYYRLRWVEATRETVYSQVRIIRLGKDQELMQLTVYPNPVTDQLRLTFPSGWQGRPVQLEVYSANGVRQKGQQFAAASQTETISLQSLARGFYLIKAVCDGQTSGQQIIKY